MFNPLTDLVTEVHLDNLPERAAVATALQEVNALRWLWDINRYQRAMPLMAAGTENRWLEFVPQVVRSFAENVFVWQGERTRCSAAMLAPSSLDEHFRCIPEVPGKSTYRVVWVVGASVPVSFRFLTKQDDQPNVVVPATGFPLLLDDSWPNWWYNESETEPLFALIIDFPGHNPQITGPFGFTLQKNSLMHPCELSCLYDKSYARR